MVLPILFFGIFTASIIEAAKWSYNYFHFQPTIAAAAKKTTITLVYTINYLGLTTNVISCLILALVVRHIHRISQAVTSGREIILAKTRVTYIVLGSLASFATAFTILQTCLLYTSNNTAYYRMTTAYIFCGGAVDLILSLLLW